MRGGLLFREKEALPAPLPEKPIAACMQAAKVFLGFLLWAKSGRTATRFRVDLERVPDESDDLLRLSGGRKSAKGDAFAEHGPMKNADLAGWRIWPARSSNL